MSTTSARDLDAAIAYLENQVEQLGELVNRPRRRQRSWRRPIALAGVAVLTVGVLAGVAGASGSTTNVSFVMLSPARALLTNTSIAAHKSSSPVVIGGSTTVPADATTVELTVSAKGASIGTLRFYPAMNPSGGSGQTLAYPGSNVVASTTIQENVGQAGELTFLNDGIGSAVVTAKIIGYSTQVTAGDINGVGGMPGDILTHDAANGASWQPPAKVAASGIAGTGGSSGQVLTNDGSGGASWQTPLPPSIAGLFSIVGFAGTFPASASTFSIGSYTVVPVQAGQTVQATISAALGSTASAYVSFDEEVCYIAPGATTPTLFVPSGFISPVSPPSVREVYTSSGTFSPTVTGNYRIGLCVRASGPYAVNNNDWVNGSVMVLNPGS